MKTMNQKYVLGHLMAITLLLAACQTTKTTNSKTADSAHNSRNSVDWAGSYQGTLPCADCPGIQTMLTLQEDGGYTLRTTYLERGDSVYTESGNFAWDENGGKITLDTDDRKFQVGENRLFALDMEGNRITGKLADHYVLQKVDGSITDKYWKLVELNGQPVLPGTTQKEPYIRLNAAENRLEATGGCNGMGGTYELQAPNRIRFSQIIRTQMACENLDVENELGRVLESTDSYHVAGDTLQLFRARMAPLAKFEWVESN